MVGTVIALAALVVCLLITITLGPIAALVVAVLVGVPLLAASVPIGGRTALQLLGARISWWQAVSAREHQYRSGPLSRRPGAEFKLPGVLAATQLLDSHDAYDRPFVVISRPSSGHYTIVLRCAADGVGLVDDEIVDSWVAHWGGFLASLGHEAGLRGATVVVDTAPDPGQRLRAQVRRTRSPHAPPLAENVMNQIVQSYPAASSANIAYVALTYSGPALARGGSKATAEILAELSRRLPGIIGALTESGAGTVEPVTAVELCEVVRAAYDPAVQPVIDEARLSVGGSGLTWGDVGPAGAQEAWDRYRHDSGTSVTWEWAEAPRVNVHAEVMHSLVAPHRSFARKRVALMFRPHDPASAARLVEADLNTASFMADSGKKRASARQLKTVKAAQKRAAEEAEGAGLVRFAVMVTATVTDPAQLPEAVSTTENLAAKARLRLRRAYGSQAAGFAATLPIGFLPWEHLVIPAEIQELL
jgi:hypothetical protein